MENCNRNFEIQPLDGGDAILCVVLLTDLLKFLLNIESTQSHLLVYKLPPPHPSPHGEDGEWGYSVRSFLSERIIQENGL